MPVRGQMTSHGMCPWNVEQCIAVERWFFTPEKIVHQFWSIIPFDCIKCSWSAHFTAITWLQVQRFFGCSDWNISKINYLKITLGLLFFYVKQLFRDNSHKIFSAQIKSRYARRVLSSNRAIMQFLWCQFFSAWSILYSHRLTISHPLLAINPHHIDLTWPTWHYRLM